MEQDSAVSDATLTEYLAAADNDVDSVDGAAALTYVQMRPGVWSADSAEELAEDPDEYRVECSCGESFRTMESANIHTESEH